MQKKIWLLSIVAAVALLLSGASVCGGEDVYVIAGGGPPVGTKITSLPYTITAPGFYYVTRDLTYSGSSHGITVQSDNVTIDLMGFRLSGPGSGSSSKGIVCNFILFPPFTAYYNVEVRNGCLIGWAYGFHGYLRSRALNLRVQNCMHGLSVSGLVKGCSVDGCSDGINNIGITTGNTVSNCSGTGIGGEQGTISGNAVSYCSVGISGSGMISGNSISNCSTYGISVATGNIGSSIIGNTVQPSSNSTGIYIDSLPNPPTLLTQNAVGQGGTPFHSGGDRTINVANTNAGF